MSAFGWRMPSRCDSTIRDGVVAAPSNAPMINALASVHALASGLLKLLIIAFRVRGLSQHGCRPLGQIPNQAPGRFGIPSMQTPVGAGQQGVEKIRPRDNQHASVWHRPCQEIGMGERPALLARGRSPEGLTDICL